MKAKVLLVLVVGLFSFGCRQETQPALTLPETTPAPPASPLNRYLTSAGGWPELVDDGLPTMTDSTCKLAQVATRYQLRTAYLREHSASIARMVSEAGSKPTPMRDLKDYLVIGVTSAVLMREDAEGGREDGDWTRWLKLGTNVVASLYANERIMAKRWAFGVEMMIVRAAEEIAQQHQMVSALVPFLETDRLSQFRGIAVSNLAHIADLCDLRSRDRKIERGRRNGHRETAKVIREALGMLGATNVREANPDELLRIGDRSDAQRPSGSEVARASSWIYALVAAIRAQRSKQELLARLAGSDDRR